MSLEQLGSVVVIAFANCFPFKRLNRSRQSLAGMADIIGIQSRNWVGFNLQVVNLKPKTMTPTGMAFVKPYDTKDFRNLEEK